MSTPQTKLSLFKISAQVYLWILTFPTGQHSKIQPLTSYGSEAHLETMACKENSLLSFSKGKKHTIIKCDTVDVEKN